MITLNAIAQRLEEFATNHFFIKSYSFGSPDDVDLEKFEVFPLMHVVYTGSDYNERTKTFSFEVYVFDRPNREEQMTTHQREVVSDAQMCLEDIVADIANGGNIFLFSEDYSVDNAGITPLIDERSNLLAGALMDLTISVPYQRDACNLPIDGVSPEGGVITYQRRGILRVREQDGTPDVQSVNEIRVSNGTLTDEGNGVVSIDTGGVDMLRDLTDVTITDVLEHDSLIYDSTASQWVNGVPTDIPVINTTAFNFTAGTPLRADGVQGDRIKINVWRPTNDPKLFMGLATEDINANTTGFVRQIGIVHHLNTEGYQIGDILYPISTLGLGMSALGTTPPTPPNHAIACAIVLRVHENTGRVYVRTWTPAYDLGDLSDVYLTTQNDGQALTWNAANNRWQAGNAAPRSLGDISDVYDYDPTTLPDRTMLRWSATSEIWELIPQSSNFPSASEVKTLYESNADTNAFTDSEQTKLAGIETGAEVNPTAAEIKTAYESNADTNAFTNAEQTKLAGIETGAEVNVNADWNAVSGDAQILNKPTLATVATTGAYADLSGTPSLATVATSGAYSDLTGTPTIPNQFFAVSSNAGTTITLNTGDEGTYIRCTASTAVTITIPADKFQVDDEIIIEQAGTGQVTISAGTSVTLNNSAANTAKTAERYSVVGLKCVASNTFTLTGERELV